MDALFHAARELHMRQFAEFLAKQRAACARGASEIRVELSEGSRCLERFYCADFICNDGKSRIVEMMPEQVLALHDVQYAESGLSLSFHELVWDDVALTHDAGEIAVDRIEPWFVRWCDPDEVRPRPEGPFSLAAHAMILTPREVWVDLGTAPVEAMAELLTVLREAGAREVDVSASRVQ